MKLANLDEPPAAGPRFETGGRRHRRRWLALPVVALLVLMLVLTDRIVLGVVERRLSDRLTCVTAMTGHNTVHIHGFPFLTQAVTGHFPTVTLTADSIGGPVRLTDVLVTFHDLRLPPLSGLTSAPPPGALRVGSMVIAATVPLTGTRPLTRLAQRADAPDRAKGLPTGPNLQVPGLPFPVRLDAVRQVPGGLRVTLSVNEGQADAAFAGTRCQR
jgi:LmeA-like phospholipid-binding